MRHDDLINLNFYERQNCITFLKYKTRYKVDKYKYPYPLKNLMAMTYRVREDLISAINEIKKLEQEKSIFPIHTNEELEGLLYEDLREIRKNLRKLKVTKVEPTSEEIIEKANIYLMNENNELMEENDLIFITNEEGYKMFGSDYELYSDRELQNMGYKREVVCRSYINEPKIKLRNELIAFINQSNPNYKLEDLYNYSLDELKSIYESLSVQLPTSLGTKLTLTKKTEF